jgi:hypothetical protein
MASRLDVIDAFEFRSISLSPINAWEIMDRLKCRKHGYCPQELHRAAGAAAAVRRVDPCSPDGRRRRQRVRLGRRLPESHT